MRGRIYKIVDVGSVRADNLAAPAKEFVPMFLADVVWILSLIYGIVNELKELGQVIRGRRPELGVLCTPWEDSTLPPGTSWTGCRSSPRW